LLDTPGMLWPKLENQKNAEILAYLGSIRDQIMDSEELAGNLIKLLMNIAPSETMARFRVHEDAKDKTVQEILEDACRGRGWLLSGARCDTERAAALILDEFRGNKVGKISLEVPEGR
ncbi:MAG: ribosome biogenesis GTPase YlqF, partial [Clostridia bacterium]|nr:ribosome biogenesis GTPase YlqF [Clostridia bacterium]